MTCEAGTGTGIEDARLRDVLSSWEAGRLSQLGGGGASGLERADVRATAQCCEEGGRAGAEAGSALRVGRRGVMARHLGHPRGAPGRSRQYRSMEALAAAVRVIRAPALKRQGWAESITQRSLWQHFFENFARRRARCLV
jgi:hypothetical protein